MAYFAGAALIGFIVLCSDVHMYWLFLCPPQVLGGLWYVWRVSVFDPDAS